MMDGWYHDGGGGGWGAWLVMTLAMVVFWALVVAAVVVLFRRSDRAGSSSGPTAPVDPLAILDERLARGDIDLDDYRTRRDALRGPP